jgi:hypothetical protein
MLDSFSMSVHHGDKERGLTAEDLDKAIADARNADRH